MSTCSILFRVFVLRNPYLKARIHKPYLHNMHLDLEPQASRHRLHDSGQLPQELHFPIQFLLQKLRFGASGLQVQISGFWPPASGASLSYSNPSVKASISSLRSPGPDFRILATCLSSFTFLLNSLVKSFDLEPQGSRSRFQVSDHLPQELYFPIQILI